MPGFPVRGRLLAIGLTLGSAALAGCSGPRDPAQLHRDGLRAVAEKRFADAERLFREAVDLHERLGQDSLAAVGLIDVGLALEAQEKYFDAEDCYERNLEICARLWGESSPVSADGEAGLGRINYALDLYQRAESAFRRAVDQRGQQPGGDLSLWARDTKQLGDALIALGRYPAADSAYQSARVLCEQVDAPGDSLRFGILLGWGEALTETGRAVEAEPQLRRALELAPTAPGSGELAEARAQSALGRCLALQGRRPEAELLLVRGYSRIEAVLEDGHRWTRLAALRLADLYADWDKPDLAGHYAAKSAR